MSVTQVGFTKHQATGTTALTIAQPAGAADGDLLIMVVMCTNTITDVPVLSGWTNLVPYAVVNTRAYNIQARVRQAGDPASFTWAFTGSAARSAILIALRGTQPVANLTTGTVTKRPALATTSTAVGVTAASDSMTLAVFVEASTSAETAGFFPTITGPFTHWTTVEQSGGTNLETISVFSTTTSGALSDAVATYPFASANGMGVQITAPAPGAVATGRPKAYVSGAWTKKPGKWHNGAAWVEKPWKRHNGTAWVPLS